MDEMAGEEVRDIDAFSERLLEKGLLKGRLGASFIPVMGVNHKQRRAFGFE